MIGLGSRDFFRPINVSQDRRGGGAVGVRPYNTVQARKFWMLGFHWDQGIRNQKAVGVVAKISAAGPIRDHGRCANQHRFCDR